MIVPRRLHKTALYPPYEIVEEEDPRQAWILCGAGTEYSALEAEQLGITAYLDAYDKAHATDAAPASEDTPPPAKAVQQSTVEDKAVDPSTTEDKGESAPASEEPETPRGVIIPPESRRLRGR